MKSVLLVLFLLWQTANAAVEKEWTFLVYLNGNNNLDSFGFLNLNQMETVGSGENLNLVVQWASLKNGKTSRVYVQKDNDPQNVTSPIVQEMGNVDMGDYHSLEDFIRWGMEHYPAKHYFVNVWDHGSGWRYMSTRKAGQINILDISFDENTGHSITTKQLGQVIQQISQHAGRKIDIYGSDACLMAMAEVAGEMKNAVDYFVGSQYLEPVAGWPYDQFLKRLAADPKMSPKNLSIALTEEYVKSYKGGTNGTARVTFSAYDMNKYDAFEGSVKKLGLAISQLGAEGKAKVMSAAVGTQSFTYSDYGDLGDFLSLIMGTKDTGMDMNAVRTVNVALNSFVVINQTSPDFSKATGLSLWLPKDRKTYDTYKNRYADLFFNGGTQWSSVLESFLK